MYPDTNSRAPGSRMEQAPGAENDRCSDGCGPLPECAPLAVPYVAFQQTDSKRYNRQEALNNGTLFPGLNLPFHLVELGQYLDTHQSDQEAFALYQQYAAMEEEGRRQYEALHGPLRQTATASSENWTQWLKDPWPWNLAEGGKR